MQHGKIMIQESTESNTVCRKTRYWHCRHSMQSKVYETVRRQSVSAWTGSATLSVYTGIAESIRVLHWQTMHVLSRFKTFFSRTETFVTFKNLPYIFTVHLCRSPSSDRRRRWTGGLCGRPATTCQVGDRDWRRGRRRRTVPTSQHQRRQLRTAADSRQVAQLSPVYRRVRMNSINNHVNNKKN